MRQPPANFNSSLDEGIDRIFVRLIMPPDDRFKEAYRVAQFFESTWGSIDEMDDIDFVATAQKVAEGKGLPNALESVNLTFAFEGISRATTHQLVRSRVGAGFGQQGGRDNNWSNFNFRKPGTFREHVGPDTHKDLEKLLILADELYKELLESGVPYQDARYVLPMGLETALVGTYNLLSLKGTLNRRLCNRMMWETNYVARKMHDLTVETLPWVGKSLRSSCETRGVCQSVSPMFPPACWTLKQGEVRLAYDNDVLTEEMGEDGYDWPWTSNGCHIHFDNLDQWRVRNEPEEEVWSLVDGRPLARQVEKGLWSRV